MEQPIFAIMYDFDRTLSPRDMQEYQFIPSLDMTPAEFWSLANDFGRRNNMDNVLAYMYMMILMSREKGVPLTRDRVVDCGKSIAFFPGLDSWFDRINAYGSSIGVTVEHYVLSSGLKEIVEGSPVGGYFKMIYASEFLYGDDGLAVFPKSAVNYTSKTQFIYRINKGVFDPANDRDLNRSTPESDRRVRFKDMLYIGDGLSDVPCMKMVKAYGGSSIAVYNCNGQRPAEAEDLLRHGRVDFLFPSDYSADTALERTVRDLIRRSEIDFRLARENADQRADVEDRQYSVFF